MDRSAATLEFSLARVDPGERNDVARDLFGRGFVNADFEFFTDSPELEARLWEFPGVVVTNGRYTPASIMTHDMSRESDDLILAFGYSDGGVCLSHRGQEIISGDGGAVLISCEDRMRSVTKSEFRPITVRLPKAALALHLFAPTERVMKPIPASSEALNLLNAYLPLACAKPVMNDIKLAEAAGRHIVELVALVLSGQRVPESASGMDGLAAARTATIMQWLAIHSARPEIAIADAARAHRLSPRYIQSLLHRAGTSFTRLLLERRLAEARRHLADPRFSTRRISEIAYAVGFTDLSYFNRSFRKQFNTSPKEIRQKGRVP